MNVTLDQNIKILPTVSLPPFTFSLQYFGETKTNLGYGFCVQCGKISKGNFLKPVYLPFSFFPNSLSHSSSSNFHFPFIFILFYRVSYISGWPGTCYIAENGLKLLIFFAFPSRVLQLQTCTIRDSYAKQALY